MAEFFIESVRAHDARFLLPPGAGTDSVHTNSEYSLGVTLLASQQGLCGTGITLTLGEGNRLICEAIEMLARPLVRVISDSMGNLLHPGTIVDLADRTEDGTYLRTIIKTENPERYGVRIADYFV